MPVLPTLPYQVCFIENCATEKRFNSYSGSFIREIICPTNVVIEGRIDYVGKASSLGILMSWTFSLFRDQGECKNCRK